MDIGPGFWWQVGMLVILGSAAYAGVSAAPWVPTLKKERDNLVTNGPWPEQGEVVELGCGDGRLLFALARRYPRLTLIGYEISILPYLVAQLTKLSSRKKFRLVQIRFKSLFSADLSGVKVVYAYLLPRSYPRLLRFIQANLATGGIFLLEGWPFEDRPYSHKIEIPGGLPWYQYNYSELSSTEPARSILF